MRTRTAGWVSFAAALTAAVALPGLVGRAAAQDPDPGESIPAPSIAVMHVRVTSASAYFGTRAVASDGSQVGQVVDLEFTLNGSPRLAYVLVASGETFDLGERVRAVPARFVRIRNGACELRLDRLSFFQLPVLPAKRAEFLAQPAIRTEIAWAPAPSSPASGGFGLPVRSRGLS